MRTDFDLRFVVKAVVASAVVAALGSGILLWSTLADDEDRPQIIVRGGSVTVDDGPSAKSKPWKMDGSKKRWQPDQPKGAPVRFFAVTVENANASGTPAAPCPALPMIATAVAIEYRYTTGQQTQVSQVGIELTQPPGKIAPVVTASVDLERVATNTAQLIYNPGSGGISKVTMTGPVGGATQTCFFDANNPAKPVITVQPLK